MMLEVVPSPFIMQIEAIQAALVALKISAWVVYDFRGSNPILAQLIPGRRFTTRRVFLLLPQVGKPTLILHSVDRVAYRDVDLPVLEYGSWQQMHSMLREHARGEIAMEYSPMGELPAVSYVDAGMIEWLRSIDVRVVSSADLIQLTVARWSEEALASHLRASDVTAEAMRGAFEMIRCGIRSGKLVNEYQVQQFILELFRENRLETVDPPIVAVNGHGGDPHFEVSAEDPAFVAPGDWVLIDLWARARGDENVYSDITWVGFCGAVVPQGHRRAYEAVAAARDGSLALAVDRWNSGSPVEGWELDEAARRIFADRGYAANIRHRTGHSLSPGPKVHGLGMNLDNLETHDSRRMLASTGFTIEPALYFADFGVRSEINVFVDPKTGPIASSCRQNDIELLV
jgi:Xaa-Pro dipeptidase